MSFRKPIFSGTIKPVLRGLLNGEARRFGGCIPGVLALVFGAALFAPAALAQESGERFKDWMLRCEKAPDSNQEACVIFQRLVNQEEQPVLLVEVGLLRGNNQPAMIFTLPLGVSLVEGVAVQVDNGEALRIPYDHCHPGGCVAGMPLNQDVIAAFKGGSKSQITIADGARKAGVLEVSLAGFTAGFDAISK